MNEFYSYVGEPLHMLHIGKTGGTAVKAALADKLEAGCIRVHGHSVRLAEAELDGKFVFFVRNPVGRFPSAFISRLRCGAPRYNYPHSEAEGKTFRRFPTPNLLAEALSSPDPVVIQQTKEAFASIFHLAHSMLDSSLGGLENLKANMDRIFFVGRFEHLEGDYGKFLGLIGWKNLEDARLSKDPITTHQTPSEFDGLKKLSHLAIANLRAHYQREYDALFCLIAAGLLPESYRDELTADR